MDWKRDYIKLLRTSLFVASWFCMGIRNGVQYSTLPDLRTRLNSTTEMMNYEFAIASIGSLAGPPLSALTDRFYQHGDLVYGMLLYLYGLMFGVKACVTQLWLYGVIEMVECMTMAVISPVANGMVLAAWGKDSQPAMQVFGLGWSIGGIFGPFIAVPFVSVDSESSSNDTANGTTKYRNSFERFIPEAYDTTSSRNDRYADDSRIEIAFWIVMICFLIVASAFILVYIFLKQQTFSKKKSYSWKEILYPSQWAEGDSALGVKVFVLFVLVFMFFTAAHNGPSTLITTYASDSPLGFDNQEAALMSSAFNFSGTVGRILAIIIAKWITVTPYFGILTHGMLISGMLMMFIGTQSKVALWVTVSLFGFFYRPVFGCMYTWTNNYIILLAALLGIQRLINNLYLIFITSLQGFLYGRNIDSIFYTTVVYSALVCVVYYCMVALGYNRETRHEKQARVAKLKPDVFVISPSDNDKPVNDEHEKPGINRAPSSYEATKL